jgi:hypothetical protein
MITTSSDSTRKKIEYGYLRSTRRRTPVLRQALPRRRPFSD